MKIVVSTYVIVNSDRYENYFSYMEFLNNNAKNKERLINLLFVYGNIVKIIW